MLQNPLAVSLLKGDITAGSTVRVKAEKGEMIFEPRAAESKAGMSG